MNSWEVIKDKYSNRFTDQKTEDLISRRIWKGLGMSGPVASNINNLELNTIGVIQYEEPLFDRLRAIFEYACRSKTYKFNWKIEAIEIKNNNEAMDHINEMALTIAYPVLFTRVKNTNDSLVFSTWDMDIFTNILIPPYTVLALEGQGSKLVAIQETTHFVGQFGPYDGILGGA